MSRILSWLVPALLIAGGWLAFKEGKPAFKRWHLKRVAEEVCKDTGGRVTRGLNLSGATDEVRKELVARADERADVRLTEYMYEVTIWAGTCTIVIKLQDGTRIKASTPFPRDSEL